MVNGFLMDSERIPNGFPTDSERIPNGFLTDSQRIPRPIHTWRKVIEGGPKMITGWELCPQLANGHSARCFSRADTCGVSRGAVDSLPISPLAVEIIE